MRVSCDDPKFVWRITPLHRNIEPIWLNFGLYPGLTQRLLLYPGRIHGSLGICEKLKFTRASASKSISSYPSASTICDIYSTSTKVGTSN